MTNFKKQIKDKISCINTYAKIWELCMIDKSITSRMTSHKGLFKWFCHDKRFDFISLIVLTLKIFIQDLIFIIKHVTKA
jgi:hypothetical protein